jgi:hypothetical protein
MKNELLTDQDKFLRTRNELPIYLGEVMIGLMLSDGSLERSSTSGVRLCVNFGKKHEDYLNFLYKPYINTNPTSIKVFNKKTDSYNDVLKP